MAGSNKRFAVLGLGQFGQSILTTLTQNGCDVLGCDSDPDTVAEMSRIAAHVAQVDITDEEALKRLELHHFDAVIVCTGKTALEAGIMATLTAKELGCAQVYARACSKRHKTILEKVGADRVFLPEWEMGERLANGLLHSNALDYLTLSERYGVVEIAPLDKWIGHSLQTLSIRSETGLSVVGVKRGAHFVISPKADEVIEAGDMLVVIGEIADIRRINRMKSRGGYGC